MEKQLTKTAVKKTINWTVYDYVRKNYPSFSQEDEGSTVYFCTQDGKSDNGIAYHRSEHTTLTMNWANSLIKIAAKDIERFAQETAAQYY